MNKYQKILLVLFLITLSNFCFAVSYMTLSKASFSQLTSWKEDDQSQALVAFQQSCQEILKRDPKSVSNPLSHIVPTTKWQVVCKQANKINKPNTQAARKFFENWFEPYYLAENYYHLGLFTGYYLPLIHASLKSTKRFQFPIHGLPLDLVKVDLGSFREDLAGKSLIGQVKNNKLVPYPTRAEMNNSNIILWADNPIDVYFAQIQGSSVVQLPNKKRVVIGYAGGNGHKYTAIGKVLVEWGELKKEEVSMQSIREWLLNHPEQINELFNQNDSYVFFKILKDDNPLGTEGVSLTPERSLAVDSRYIPFGTPVWVKTTIPAYQSEKSSQPFRQLLIAQDTGGAIKGVVRGDIYWGTGDKAEFIAGHMNQVGESWILLPR